MFGTVTASRLNVRTRPHAHSSVCGVLPLGAALDVQAFSNHWLRIEFDGHPAYVSDRFVELATNLNTVAGEVTASNLNVRTSPSLNARILGRLAKGSKIDVISAHPPWLEVAVDDGVAYVSQDYVRLSNPCLGAKAHVTANRLNLRSTASYEGEVMARLTRGTQVLIHAMAGEWYEVSVNGQFGFVHHDYLRLAQSPEDGYVRVEGGVDGEDDADLRPDKLLPLAPRGVARKVARTWNNYGRLLERLATEKCIDVACIIAVLCVESSGAGFQKSNNNRMIIRFENHKFWKYWGRQHAEDFNAHFKFASGKVWTGHKWRIDEHSDWIKFHGNQKKEWDVLEFARNLNDEAALLSISMGAPQIMGFHFKRLGYASVQEMFDHFNRGIEAHIHGLFDFLDSAMTKDLQHMDFRSFAGRYNGSGQKEKYGKWIQEHYESCAVLMS